MIIISILEPEKFKAFADSTVNLGEDLNFKFLLP
jgi:hypothetical protein